MNLNEKLAVIREKTSYQTGLLAFVGLLTSAALTMANQATQAPIESSLQKDLQVSLAQVLPAGGFDNNLLASTLQRPAPEGMRTVYLAKKNGQVIGAVFQVSSKGYAGPVRLVMGVDPAGRVLGVRVLSHAETPGLGDKIEVQKSSWINSFVGKALGNAKWAVKKDGGDFDQFAGATITPRGVVKAVHGGLEWYAQERNAILQGESAKENAK